MSGINTRCRTRAVPTRSLLKSLFGRGDGVSIHRSGSSRNIDPHWNISDTLYRKQTCIGNTPAAFAPPDPPCRVPSGPRISTSRDHTTSS